MLSVFPILLSYNMAVPFVFRLVSGVLFLAFGYLNFSRRRHEKSAAFERARLRPGAFWLSVLAVVEIAAGVFLFVGFYLQIAAAILSVLALIALIAKSKNADAIKPSAGFLFLLLLITVSLLFLGPGFYSIDLPL
ncbi:DoxX family membrane protein [Patescibacteria group bacterium]|nr:DoxX family membrane protein [Patescibacteria group bacterium]